MRALKRTIATFGILLLSLPISFVANAASTKDTLNSAEKQLEQNQQTILQKEKEQKAVDEEVKKIQENVQALEAEISENVQSLTNVENEIKAIQKIIEEKKEQIVLLQDKVYAREGIMEQRLVALQHSDHTTIVIETLINSESIGNFFERIGAVATLLNADKKILDEQEADLKQIEEDKKEIDKQEQLLISQQAELESKRAALEANYEKRNQALISMQEKYKAIAAEINLVEQEKGAIQAQINTLQSQIQKEEAAAKARAEAAAKAKKAKEEAVSQQTAAPPASTATNESTSSNSKSESSKTGKEMYVTATAYSHEDTKNDVTYMGHNIKKNPHMKLIAVDPGVIPLGSKVWVEGYGVAIAGDTGGAIIGHKIDVLMPNSAKALQWGRKTVKIKILD
ncbi:3D domain-containing protein [Metabacillus malikii]|uniref:3D (Asp-Asp-Asp) domain-containing protein/predicted nucleic acid-binding Zn-ribbon protein n=1 Tax=Metabacillus malikii TaxID=1504265 RepID=A0ABT9ZEW5_9BACI|nr:3D domain-containing protein [Metabacillus malikii]MDQ0230377.1 3D (Asp-Asp-Asp) domain-containing protein/predicted nucleic acid-binding Zn-ribbon protein [Metabacillus malikii]